MSEPNLPPELLLMFPRPVVAESFLKVPETCPAVRQVLDELMAEVMQTFSIPAEDAAAVDASFCRAFCHIRDRATVPLRLALTQQINQSHNAAELSSE